MHLKMPAKAHIELSSITVILKAHAHIELSFEDYGHTSSLERAQGRHVRAFDARGKPSGPHAFDARGKPSGPRAFDARGKPSSPSVSHAARRRRRCHPARSSNVGKKTRRRKRRHLGRWEAACRGTSREARWARHAPGPNAPHRARVDARTRRAGMMGEGRSGRIHS